MELFGPVPTATPAAPSDENLFHSLTRVNVHPTRQTTRSNSPDANRPDAVEMATTTVVRHLQNHPPPSAAIQPVVHTDSASWQQTVAAVQKNPTFANASYNLVSASLKLLQSAMADDKLAKALEDGQIPLRYGKTILDTIQRRDMNQYHFNRHDSGSQAATRAKRTRESSPNDDPEPSARSSKRVATAPQTPQSSRPISPQPEFRSINLTHSVSPSAFTLPTDPYRLLTPDFLTSNTTPLIDEMDDHNVNTQMWSQYINDTEMDDDNIESLYGEP